MFSKRRRSILLGLTLLFIVMEIWFNLEIARDILFHPNYFVLSTLTSWSYAFKFGKPPDVGNQTVLLYWNHPWFATSEGQPDDSKIGDCIVTYDRRLIKEATAIIFHYTVIGVWDIPWKHYRNENQLFIWHSAEAPPILKQSGHANARPFDGFFNWTYTYRRDSDVLGGYGYRGNALNSVPLGKAAIDKVISNKKKVAIWIVSDCNYVSGARMRMKLSEDLIKAGLDLHRYGKCFHNEGELPRSNKDFTEKVIREHKFYLAFENALHCKDYITEKFWNNALQKDIVPVVWGPTKEDILSVAPLDSFIFAEDFESPKKLVEYLQFLDSNELEYRKYFRWREDESMTDEKMLKMTKLKYPSLKIQEKPKNICERILENKYKKVIESLDDDFLNNNPKECTNK